MTVGANTYKGNVFASGVSITGGSADTVNNVENVFLPAGIAVGTSFSITVSATALNGDGVLGNADTTDQHFALVAYNFNESAAPSPAISGTVTYGNAIGAPPTRFVSNVQINGAGSPAVATTTGGLGATEGQYSLTGFGAGAYTLTPAKTTGVNSISSNDAGRVAQHVSGSVALTGNQLIVADVSNNGSISSTDAALIARYAAALGPPVGAAGTWRFTPASRNYAAVTANVSGQDYAALLMGEVTGNWTNSGARPDGGQLPIFGAEEIVVDLPKAEISADKEITIPVGVQGVANKGIISYEFDLKYDPSIMQPLAKPADVTGTVSRGLSVVANAEEPGLLRVVVYGSLPIEKDGVLLNLRFRAVGAAGSISPLAFGRIMFNEGDLVTVSTDGQIEIGSR